MRRAAPRRTALRSNQASMGLNEAVASVWQRRGIAASLLLPVALVFTLVRDLRRLLYRIRFLETMRLPVPVVVVGNITAGGSGKTPLVLYLARELGRLGYRPGIVSRGYGGNAHGVHAVTPESDPAEIGDEPLLLVRRAGCPVFVGRDRVAAARALLAAHAQCDVLLADDGLQHYRLERDVEFVVIDERGIGNGWPLPAGPLRERPRRIAEVDALVLNGDHAKVPPGAAPRQVFRMRLAGERFRNLRDPGRTCGVEDLRGRRVHALAGTGDPTRFFRQLEALGLRFVAHGFPDHYRFRAADMAFEGAEVLLMTEKDAVKCEAFAPEEAWVLPVEAQLDPDPVQWLVETLNRGCHGRQVA